MIAIAWHGFSMASEITVYEEGMFLVGPVPSLLAYSLYPHIDITIPPYNNGQLFLGNHQRSWAFLLGTFKIHLIFLWCEVNASNPFQTYL